MSVLRSLACAALILTAACGSGGTEATGALTAVTEPPPTATPAPTRTPTAEPTPLATAQPVATADPAATKAPATPRPTPVRSPTATLASEAGEVEGVRGSYCWTPDDHQAGTCADAIPTDPDEALVVRQGETLTLAFDHPHGPKSVRIHRYEDPFEGDAVEEVDVPDENPARFTTDFPKGTFWLTVSSFWDEGDAYYYFEVDVR